jgi:hypothetical protein
VYVRDMEVKLCVVQTSLLNAGGILVGAVVKLLIMIVCATGWARGEFAYGCHTPEMCKILRPINFFFHVFMLAK